MQIDPDGLQPIDGQLPIVLTTSDILDYLLWWRFVEKDGVRFWFDDWRPERRRHRPGWKKPGAGLAANAFREVRIDQVTFPQLFQKQGAVIDGVAVRVASWDEPVKNAYADHPPMDCYVPYDHGFGCSS